MSATEKNNFKWDELLARIETKGVIPVIGQGLYRVRTLDNKEVLLYRYLADRLAQYLNLPSPEQTNHAFSKMIFEYLKKNPNDYLGLKNMLTPILTSLYPIHGGPLWKLARIKPFSLFINTTYDHFLEHSLNSVRNYPTEVLHHTYREKRTDREILKQPDMLEDSNYSLVFHIYGSISKNQVPSYTENDVLETIVTFQKDMEKYPENPLFQTLKEKSMLFIGCGYNDWLFRFFVRTIANEPYRNPRDPRTWKFVEDDYDFFNCGELGPFLKAYDSEVFYSAGGKDFVDLLFDKMESKHPEHIITEEEFPETAFISFHGANRQTAMRLASYLMEDGVKVWLDQRVFKPGDRVDETIVKAIGKCTAFIPLISKEAEQVQGEDTQEVKYHIREWEWAYSKHLTGNNPKYIIPVIIDNTDRIYEPFKNLFAVRIPDGKRGVGYGKLKDRLLEIQNNTR